MLTVALFENGDENKPLHILQVLCRLSGTDTCSTISLSKGKRYF